MLLLSISDQVHIDELLHLGEKRGLGRFPTGGGTFSSRMPSPPLCTAVVHGVRFFHQKAAALSVFPVLKPDLHPVQGHKDSVFQVRDSLNRSGPKG